MKAQPWVTVVLAAVIGGVVALGAPALGAPVGTGVAVLVHALLAQVSRGRAGVSAVMASVAAAGLRWAVVATLAPAYPVRAAQLSGAGVAALVAGVVALWAARDLRELRVARP